MAPINLNGNAFSLEPATPDQLAKATWVLIKFKNEVSLADEDALDAKQFLLYEHLGDLIYLCRQYNPLNSNEIPSQLLQLSFVAVAGVWDPKFVASPETKAALSAAKDATGDARPSLSVVLFDDSDDFPQKAVAEIKKNAPSANITRQEGAEIVLKVDYSQFDKVAAVPNIRSIALTPVFERTLDEARIITKAKALQDSFPFGVASAYTGGGQVIAVADSGIDTAHPALKDRIARVATFGGFDPVVAKKDTEGHGTAVAGCAVAAPTQLQTGPKTTILGGAPGAKVCAIGFEPGRQVANLPKLFEISHVSNSELVTDRPAIHNNSWNTVSRHEKQDAYLGITAGAVDGAMRKNHELLIVFAAGNDGKSFGPNGCQISSCAAAKNCLTVGALENRKPIDVLHSEYQKGKAVGKADQVAVFSNRGPTLEGRIKPDVVAPGAAVLTTLSSNVPQVDPGQAFAEFEGDKRFCYVSGTSFAAPIVSGYAAILREAYLQSHAGDPLFLRPTGALLKALIINGARDIKGGHALIMPPNGFLALPGTQPSRVTVPPLEPMNDVVIDAAPNGIQGYGCVDIENSLTPAISKMDNVAGCRSNIWLTMANPVRPDDPNKKYYHEETWSNPYPTDINITLAWTDPPGAAMQNLFRLEASVMPKANGVSLLSKLPDIGQDWRRQKKDWEDRIDPWNKSTTAESNVQKISWTNVPAGKVTVRVVCTRLAPVQVSDQNLQLDGSPAIPRPTRWNRLRRTTYASCALVWNVTERK